MKLNVIGIALLAAAFATAPAAFADSTFDFTYTGSDGLTATGTLNGNLASPGVYDITTGTIDITNSTYVTGMGSLIANSNFPGTSNVTDIIYDDGLMPSANPQLNYDGLLFSVGGKDVNFYYDNGYAAYGDNGLIDTGTFNATMTPEPSSLLLLGTGLLGAAGIARRKIAAKFA